MVYESFIDAREAYLALSTRSTEKVRNQHKEIIRSFYKLKKTTTAKELLDELDPKLGIDIDTLNRRLADLVKKGIIMSKGKKLTYIWDVLHDKPCFGPDIGKAIDLSLSNLLNDIAQRSAVQEIFASILKEYSIIDPTLIPPTLTLKQLRMYVDEDDLLDLYAEVLKAIVAHGLYDKNYGYGELRWQNKANRYSLPEGSVITKKILTYDSLLKVRKKTLAQDTDNTNQ